MSSYYFNQLHFKHSIWCAEGQRCTQEILSGWTYLKFQKYMFTLFPRQSMQRFLKSPHKHTKPLKVQPLLPPELITHGDSYLKTPPNPPHLALSPRTHHKHGNFEPGRWGRRRWRVPGRLTGASQRHLGGAAALCTPFPRKLKEIPARAGERPAAQGAAVGSRRGQHLPRSSALHQRLSCVSAPWSAGEKISTKQNKKKRSCPFRCKAPGTAEMWNRKAPYRLRASRPVM